MLYTNVEIPFNHCREFLQKETNWSDLAIIYLQTEIIKDDECYQLRKLRIFLT